MLHEDPDNGFTLIELMVVVLIIGVLVAIAVPVFTSVKGNAERKACWSNERMIEGAYQQYLANDASATAVSDWTGLKASVIPSRIATVPLCPAGGEYSFDGLTVYCTIHGTYHDAH